MRPEELIRKKLLACKELEKKLTRYAGGPAIFFGEAPDDNQAGWSNRSTMPRISLVYTPALLLRVTKCWMMPMW